MPHVLMVGCGDLGQRLGLRMQSLGWQISALRRNRSDCPTVLMPFVGTTPIVMT